MVYKSLALILEGILNHPCWLLRRHARARRRFSTVLAATIIFGGGPVGIPLLREYVVAKI